MTFQTSKGTYGARQPGRAMVWINRAMAQVIKRTGRIGGSRALLLTTVGRKSGQERTTPVNWFPGEDGTWLVVASAAGAVANPAWYLNLSAAPDQVRITVDGRTVEVRAERLTGEDRATAWSAITAAAPNFAGYESKTDREIPVVRLSPR
ncbi:MAG: nitroreductase family deazaflavin-dependent oxidoreductase [Phycicoccus sp.]|nr:nitroreductase family deazaflavin-dependent oxidoreductase [Phycicoccus sp.]